MKKKIIAAACLAAVMAFTGCANNETSSNSSSTSSSTKSSKSEESSSKPESSNDSYAPESSSEPEESSAPETNANEADFKVANFSDGSGSVYILEYNGSDENVVIPETIGGKPVVQIKGGAFTDNIDITSVTIPASVTLILGSQFGYSGAFKGCINLKEVTFLGDSVPGFTAADFEGTPWLEAKMAENPDYLVVNNALVQWGKNEGSATIPDGINQICQYAFMYLDKITSVSIPNSVTEIGGSAFGGCSSLESVNIPDGITEIGEYAFSYCRALKSIIIPDGVTKIGDCAFYGCGFKSISIPDSVTEVGENAFSSEELTYKGITYNIDYDYSYGDFYEVLKQSAIAEEFGDKDFIITDNVLETVRPDAEKIELPDTLKGIADNAFDGCDKSIIIAFKGKNYNLANLDKLKEDVSGN